MDPESPSRPPVAVVGERFAKAHRFDVEQVKAFATAAGDDNPLHHDEAAAAASRYGRLIASGTQTSALLLGLTASHFSKRGPVVGVGFSLAFKRPVYADERVTIEWIITAIRPRASGKGHLIDLEGSLRNDAGEVCVAATGTVLAFD
jgi:acyl dehydratase